MKIGRRYGLLTDRKERKGEMKGAETFHQLNFGTVWIFEKK